MNREQKGAVIDEIAADIEASEAIFAVDYKGISVPQAAELRTKLREADATFRVVKNSLTELAADKAGRAEIKPLLVGPTALTFVRGDAAVAAKAIADYARATQLLPFKGGTMGTEVFDAAQIVSISRLPSREVLYGQLVGVVASPVSGLVRTLGALVGGLAVALGQVKEKKESGEITAGEAPAAAAEPDAPQAPAAEAKAPAETEVPAEAEEPAAEVPAEEPAEEAPAEEPQEKAESTAQEPETQDDNQADASAQSETAEATKED
ncbi:MAG TPA: 50S ribosomal protein L10 [Solirubrobacteraceae bacterium]|jgi:large subunit ribosomal protein L10|nr:50S ribosomal protein L10 [Solirubrobacteraceae bacterium]